MVVRRRKIAAVLLLTLTLFSKGASFQTVTSWGVHSRCRLGRPAANPHPTPTTQGIVDLQHGNPRGSSSLTSLNMFMGSDGGLLGIGGPELFTILLVGYFVLGPSDLYKLVKEIGKFIQNIRSLGTDLSTTFESNMENQLQLQELRKAQRELTDAFSFRRSINVDDSEAFATTATTPRAEEALVGGVAALGNDGEDNATRKRKKIKRRKRQPTEEELAAQAEATAEPAPPLSTSTFSTSSVATEAPTSSVGNVPDLTMPGNTEIESTGDPFVNDTPYGVSQSGSESKMTPEEEAEVEREFAKYSSNPMPSSSNDVNGWYGAPDQSRYDAAAQSRFQQQVAGDWNKSVMANEDKLSPLAKVMEMLAVLEKEKVAKTRLLEEEFRKRAEMEDAFYQKQRTLLEEAAAQVQTDAYNSFGKGGKSSKRDVDNDKKNSTFVI